MFTAFLRPARRELIVAFLVLTLMLGFGRFLAGDGQAWNILACSASAIAFAVITSRLPAVLSLDVPLRTWLTGLTVSALLWSGLLAVVGTTAAVIMQLRSPYYAWYDTFLVTDGPKDWVDTNGAPYVVDEAGMNLATVLLTFLVYFLAFVFSTLIGAMVGIIRLRFGVVAAVLSVALVLAAVIGALIWINMSTLDHSLAPFPVRTSHNYQREYLTALIPGILIAGLLTWLSARRTEP